MISHSWGCRMLFVLALFAHVAVQAGQASPPLNARLPSIQKIVIARPHAQSAYGSDADCSDMRIDATRVRHFLAHAIEGTAEEYRRGIDQADCEASAEVHWRRGSKATISLDDATGWGSLEQRGTTRYFYCSSCEGILGRDFRPDAARWRAAATRSR